MEREESGSSREHHLPPVKDESVIRVFVRPLHGISAASNEPAPLANLLSGLSLSLQCDASAPRDLSLISIPPRPSSRPPPAPRDRADRECGAPGSRRHRR